VTAAAIRSRDEFDTGAAAHGALTAAQRAMIVATMRGYEAALEKQDPGA
jgi:hypothetical protein